MKRTISIEAQAAVSVLKNYGFTPACIPPSRLGSHGVFAALGLQPEAKWPEIRQAFVARLRQFPPDRHPEEFVQVVDAYDTLKKHYRDVAAAAAQAEAACVAQEGGSQAAKRRRGFAGQAMVGGEAAGGASPSAASTGCGAAVIALDMTGVAHVGGAAPCDAAAALPAHLVGVPTPGSAGSGGFHGSPQSGGHITPHPNFGVTPMASVPFGFPAAPPAGFHANGITR